MSDSITYSRLAVCLLSDLSESAEAHTTDDPLEMVQLGLVLKAFDEVSNLTEQRLTAEVRRPKPEHTPEVDSDSGN